MVVRIKKLVFGGYGLGKNEKGEIFFVLNALPDEEVEVEVLSKKKKIYFGIAHKILNASPFRQEPKEDHFLACSCFQIIQDQAELQFKKEIFKETFEKIANIDLDTDIEIESDVNFYSYRNKMEFSLISSPPSLAFFKRNTHQKIKIDSCLLAKEKINEVAQKIIKILPSQEENFYKSLIIRQDGNQKVVAALFVTQEKNNFLKIENLTNIKDLKGFLVFFSPSTTPASLPQKLILSEGQNILQDKILNKEFNYSVLNFFQINLPLFEKVLLDIKNYVEGEIVDFYSGVGAIGISLAPYVQKVILIESDTEAYNFALRNILLNGTSNVKAFCQKSENLIDFITRKKIIIFDPPRAGLHPKIIAKILKERPKRIIYLSCNPSTQARDFGNLKKYYQIKFLKLYNFFPKTHHLESLLIAETI